MRFATTGYEDDDQGVDGVDVMGHDVMGRHMAVVGYDDYGYPIVVGARPRQRRGGPRRAMVPVEQPAWRARQLAPGVIAPGEGLETLPMGTFTFTATAQTNTFQGQVQKPFEGERWLIRVVRVGATATGILLANLFAGTDLAQLDVTPVDLESLANPQAFGVRNSIKPVQPGVFIRAVCSLSAPLGGTDTIQVSLQLLGKLIH